MIKTLEKTARTEDEAIAAALAELGMDRDDVSVEIVERAKSGFLGIGAQPAKVQVTYEAPDPVPEAPKVALSSASRSKPKAPAKKPEPKPEEAKPEQPPEEKPEEPPPEETPPDEEPPEDDLFSLSVKRTGKGLEIKLLQGKKVVQESFVPAKANDFRKAMEALTDTLSEKVLNLR